MDNLSDLQRVADSPSLEQARFRELQSLYGERVLPEDVISFFSSFTKLETTVSSAEAALHEPEALR